jgi:dihydropyrimidinase
VLDLIVSGGTAVTPAATEAAEIGIAGGKIVAIGAPGSLQSSGAARTIDASGQIVIPGGVDPHIIAARRSRSRAATRIC